MAERLMVLRKQADRDRGRAQDDTWDWVKGLGRRRDAASLDTLFELGTAPRDLDGPTDGILVTPLINPLVDIPIGHLTRIWSPWRGKVFDAKAKTGINRLASGAALPVKLLWPFYRVRQSSDGPSAFEFVSGAEPGKIEPRVPVLKIDYQPISANPHFLIRQIRDEVVEVVPGTYLGRVLFRLVGDRFANIGYFALRQPVSAG